ncbi:MAG: FAD-dependent oxidoreductase [Candidatus Pacebacteria bacterium]|nr:FAD-dependent oxidoreductase [Candidatus Paceibacterota bacterium]
MKVNNREFILVDKKEEAENVTSLFFRPTDNLDYTFVAGQYVNITPQSSSGHGKSYTISSIPSEKLVCLTIKRRGKTSNTIIDYPVGTKVLFDGPYGFFYPEEEYNEIVMIAGGIGVTPFRSVIKDIVDKKKNTKVTLFYSNQYIKDISFLNELDEISKNSSQIKVIHCLTQEKTKHPLVNEYSRISEKLLKKQLVTFTGKSYYICGSIHFVNDFWKLLKDKEVSESDIFTESFF